MSKHKKRLAAIERQKLGTWFPGAKWEPRNEHERRIEQQFRRYVSNLPPVEVIVRSMNQLALTDAE